MRRAGSADPILDVGNVTEFKTTPSSNKIQVPNRRGGGGNAFSKRTLDELLASMVFSEISTVRLSMVMGGSTSIETGAAIVSETHAALENGFIALGILDPATPPVVQDDTDATTYEVGTDYILERTGITWLNPDAALHISYSTVDTEILNLFMDSGEAWEVYLDGINEADNSSWSLQLHKWVPEFAEFGFIGSGEEAELLTSEGEAVADLTKTGAADSKFGILKIAKVV